MRNQVLVSASSELIELLVNSSGPFSGCQGGPFLSWGGGPGGRVSGQVKQMSDIKRASFGCFMVMKRDIQLLWDIDPQAGTSSYHSPNKLLQFTKLIPIR